MKPASGKGLIGRRRVLQIALHHGVAAQHQLAHRLAVARHFDERLRIKHRRLLQGDVANPLARHTGGPLLQVQIAPGILRRAVGRRAVAFRQAVGVDHLEALLLHVGDHRRGRRRAAGDDQHRPSQFAPHLSGGMGQQVQHDGRAAEMGDLSLLDQGIDQFGIDPAQADMGALGGGHAPGEGPAGAVEHRQRPKVDAAAVEAVGHRLPDRVQVGAAVMVDHALGVAGGTRGVEQAERLPLVVRQLPGEVRIAFLQKRLVVEGAEPGAALAALRLRQRIVDVDHQGALGELLQRALDGRRELAVRDQHLCLAVLQNEGEIGGVETDVERIEHGAGQGNAEMRLQQSRYVRRHDGNGIAPADPAFLQSRGETAHPRSQFGVTVDTVVNDGRLVRIDLFGALQETQRRKGDPVGGAAIQIAVVDRQPAVLRHRHLPSPCSSRTWPGLRRGRQA